MTIDVQDVPTTQRASEIRPRAGLGVGIAVSALVAVPVGLSVFLAVIGFSEGGPWIGVLFTGIVLLLLALPVVAGLVTARVLTASGWKIALGNHALIGAIERPTCLGLMRNESSEEAPFLWIGGRRKSVPDAYEYACR